MSSRAHHIGLLKCAESKDLVFESPYLRLQAGSSIVNCSVGGGHMLGMGTCWANCSLGRYVATGSWSFLSSTKVGSYCTFGSRASIGAFNHPLEWLSVSEFQYRDTQSIYGESIHPAAFNSFKFDGTFQTKIGSDVWIGDNAVVRRGASLGTGCVIGAGAVVIDDVEPYAIVVGNPARKIRSRFDQETVQRLLMSRWWEQSISFFKDFPFDDIKFFLDEYERRCSAGR